MNKYAFLIPLALMACAVEKQQVSVAATCYEIGVALENIAPFRKSGQLDAKGVGVVNKIVAETDPVCKAPVAPSATSVAGTALLSAASQLGGIVRLLRGE